MDDFERRFGSPAVSCPHGPLLRQKLDGNTYDCKPGTGTFLRGSHLVIDVWMLSLVLRLSRKSKKFAGYFSIRTKSAAGWGLQWIPPPPCAV